MTQLVSHNTYPLDRDLSSGERYPAFEQLESCICRRTEIKLINMYLKLNLFVLSK